ILRSHLAGGPAERPPPLPSPKEVPGRRSRDSWPGPRVGRGWHGREPLTPGHGATGHGAAAAAGLRRQGH
ncbi:hypothetical protein P7K49_015172, partial [Saguinus oedipus]